MYTLFVRDFETSFKQNRYYGHEEEAYHMLLVIAFRYLYFWNLEVPLQLVRRTTTPYTQKVRAWQPLQLDMEAANLMKSLRISHS